MQKQIVTIAAVVVVVAAGLARAQDPVPPAGPPPPAPTPDEIRRVHAYYVNGKDVGPILLELSLCNEIGKNAEGKNACVTPLPATVKKGDSVTAFVKFFSPKGSKYEDLKIRFLLNGEVRTTSDFTVTESWSYGNYKKTTVGKPGTWEVQVMRGETVLDSKKVSVE